MGVYTLYNNVATHTTACHKRGAVSLVFKVIRERERERERERVNQAVTNIGRQFSPKSRFSTPAPQSGLPTSAKNFLHTRQGRNTPICPRTSSEKVSGLTDIFPPDSERVSGLTDMSTPTGERVSGLTDMFPPTGERVFGLPNMSPPDSERVSGRSDMPSLSSERTCISPQ